MFGIFSRYMTTEKANMKYPGHVFVTYQPIYMYPCLSSRNRSLNETNFIRLMLLVPYTGGSFAFSLPSISRTYFVS